MRQDSRITTRSHPPQLVAALPAAVLSPAQRKNAALDIAAPSEGHGSGAPSVGDTTSKEAVRLQVRFDSASG